MKALVLLGPTNSSHREIQNLKYSFTKQDRKQIVTCSKDFLCGRASVHGPVIPVCHLGRLICSSFSRLQCSLSFTATSSVPESLSTTVDLKLFYSVNTWVSVSFFGIFFTVK